MIIRYVIGRPEAPHEPKILKAGGVSKNVRADTTAALYRRACEAEEVEPDAAYLEHLVDRDARAWVYSLDLYASPDLIEAAISDTLRAQTRLARYGGDVAPERNAWHCQMCRWWSHCDGDPTGRGFDHWIGIEDARPATALQVRQGSSGRGKLVSIRRDRPGFACSPSEVRAVMQCPRLWWIEYHKRRRQAREGMASLRMLIGSITHRLIELGTREPSTNLHVEARVLTTEIAAGGGVTDEVADVITDRRQVQAFADRAGEMIEAAMIDVAEVVEVEARRAMVLPGTKKWLHGVPDAVVRFKNGQLGVVEYKTTTSTKDLEKAADRYRSNMAVHLYAALVQRGRLAEEGTQ